MPSCHIIQSWRGRPLCREVVVDRIGGTHTRKGLHIDLGVDDNDYPAGGKVYDAAPGDLAL
jgi:hypothetical protein